MTDKMAESPQMPMPGFTRYRVESSGEGDRGSYFLWWALIVVAVVIIAAMVYLLVTEGLI
jgi:hypothetical protein